jgi:methyl-accepting chemotaxis protein
VNRLRNRLILIFLAATLVPLGATMWYTTSLFQRDKDALKAQAQKNELKPQKFAAAGRASWPEAVRDFADGKEVEQFVNAGPDSNRLDYLVRHGDDVWMYSASLQDIAGLSHQIAQARELVDVARERDLRRGIKLYYILAAASFWLISLALLVYMAHRISRPIQHLTRGLTELSAGDLTARVAERRDDEIGRAIKAFNDMAPGLPAAIGQLADPGAQDGA